MKSVKVSHYLYTASLFFLIFLTAVCIALSGADVIIQALTDRSSSGHFVPRNLLVVSSSYVLLALASLLFSCSRMITVRSSLQDIPKLYIPIKKEDLPKKVFSKIQQEFEQAKETRRLTQPRSEDIQAVGRARQSSNSHINNGIVIPPGYEGLDFRQIISRTPYVLESFFLDISRPPSVTVSQFMEDLVRQRLIDGQIAATYIKGYEKSRFSDQPLTPEEYMEIMKALVVIIKQLGQSIDKDDNGVSNELSTSASPTSNSNNNQSMNPDLNRPTVNRLNTAASSILSSFSGLSFKTDDDDDDDDDDDAVGSSIAPDRETSMLPKMQKKNRGKGRAIEKQKLEHPSTATAMISNVPQHRNSTASSGTHISHYYGKRRNSKFVADDAQSWMSRSTYHTYTSHSSSGKNIRSAYRKKSIPSQKKDRQRPMSFGSSNSSMSNTSGMDSINSMRSNAGRVSNANSSREQKHTVVNHAGNSGTQTARSLRTAKALHMPGQAAESDSILNLTDEEGGYSTYDEDEVRQDIYEMLMKDKFTQHPLS
ncbi:hypothetical protein BDF20DRAFT_917708 [Mycotypha africana]|uniref:uncharacterized protein n=1 Tax=Mycotypha africana TaxID=64632 RepID=UPI002300FCA0|nr:uncharacterized protein BDF20DRAFT_917708 [Mycotypha africana]KAI8967232.1 hypothetical protein BDF20DRAFT_917708 [Mycotypha africana]